MTETDVAVKEVCDPRLRKAKSGPVTHAQIPLNVIEHLSSLWAIGFQATVADFTFFHPISKAERDEEWPGKTDA